MEDLETLAKLAKMANADSSEDFDEEAMAAAQEKLKLILDQSKRNAMPGISIHYSIYLIAFIVIFGTVGFFGYKLYTSLYEKERKREEKRKLKEMKKKK